MGDGSGGRESKESETTHMLQAKDEGDEKGKERNEMMREEEEEGGAAGERDGAEKGDRRGEKWRKETYQSRYA